MPRILLVEDDELLAKALSAYLRKEGYEVDRAADGSGALEAFARRRPDLILLDWMLPGLSGLEVAHRVREASSTPIIMLTARVQEDDRVTGLEMGADDYLTKPFGMRELLARVRAVLRRAQPQAQAERLAIGGLTVDVARHEVYRDGRRLELTPTEFRLLVTLARRPGRVFSRAQLLDAVRGSTYAHTLRAVDTAIKRLRRKVEPDPHRPRYILTVYGLGYKLVEPEPEVP